MSMSRLSFSARAAALMLAALAGTAARTAAVQAAEPATDPYLWLETVDSPRVNAWVAAENARTVTRLESDPRLKAVEGEVLTILESRDRIAEPAFIGGKVYNLWQDKDHHQGLWRRTTLASYLTADAAWEPVRDIDALSVADKVNWVVHGTDCPRQAAGHCLISLSAGGEDASRDREFDLATRSFVAGGFDLPRSKQRIAWEDKDTLLVVRDWGQGSQTTSGYGFVVKRLHRGQSLDQAQEVFRGAEKDGGYGVTPIVLTDASGHSLALISRRTPDAAATELRTSLGQIFRRSGAEISQFEAAAMPGDRRYPHTIPVEFRLHAKVSPDTFLSIIKIIREERPDIIVQTFELVPMDKDVRIMLAGEVVCWDAV